MRFNIKFNTILIRSGGFKSNFNEHSEILFLTSSFCFYSAYQAENFFKNSNLYNIYSRFSNPSLIMLQNKLANLENTQSCLVVSSGMAAILLVIFSILKPGDYIVSFKNLFGSTLNFFINILFKFNILVRFVNSVNINLWIKSVCIDTKIFFIESPSNPLMDVLDIKNLSYFSKKYNILLIVDNSFCTPVLQNPSFLGADVIIHSCTKFLDGQGRVLGGAILGKKDLIINKIFLFLRITGAILSVFNAWVIFKSLETLSIRIKTQSRKTLILSKLLILKNIIFNIFYPNIYSFQYKLSKSQQILSGSILSFNIKGNTNELQRINSWKIINYTNLISITANLGDTRTIITHPSTTTHSSINYVDKFLMKISESLIRISVGLEDIWDIYIDLFNGLKKI